MTDLVYYSKLYKGYNNGSGLINPIDQNLHVQLINACNPKYLFINSTWMEFDEDMIRLLDQQPEKIIVYSGMDWHDVHYRKNVHEKLQESGKQIIYIGNTGGEGYFSFWLFFIEKYIEKFTIESPREINIDKLFMCLNRKRHGHRVELVEKLLGNKLEEVGLVSLGGDSDTPPLLLNEDITYSAGDSSASANFEGILNDIDSFGLTSNWNRHLINIVTETICSTDTFISEKTWKPILGLKPFMILGDNKIYSYLKEYGIDTFDDIFGTGYEIPYYKDRINWIIDNLNRYRNINYNQFYIDLLPRLEANRNRMQEIFKINKTKYENVLKTLS